MPKPYFIISRPLTFVSAILIGAIFWFHLGTGEATAASITIRSDRDKIASNESVTLSGSVLPKKTKLELYVLGSNRQTGKYQPITTAQTNKKGRYTVALSPSETQYIKIYYRRNGKKIFSREKKLTVSDELSIIAPYVNESEISSVNEAYSRSADAPWGFEHKGVDFFITSGTTPVQAVTDGEITNVAIVKEENQMGWHVGFCITYGVYAPCYNLETFSQDDAIGEQLTANVFISDGQVVKQGDILANLVYGGSGAHIDFGIGYDNDRICPEQYFTEEARESVMRLIANDHPDWDMCYE